MLFESLSWVLFTLTLFVAVPGALASSAPKKTKKSPAVLETYSAYEGDEDADEVTEATPPPSSRNRRVQTLGNPAPIGNTPSESVTAISEPESFDEVPPAKRMQILRRMRLCELIFQATGRAYDYRSMTTASLEKHLADARANGRAIAVESPANPSSTTERNPLLDAQE